MARKKRVSRTELVELLWQSRYPIIVPAYIRDYVITFVFVLACACFGGWLLVTGQNMFYGLILTLLGGAMAIFCIITLIAPSWRRMVIFEDHASTAIGKISFEHVDQFEGGYPVRIRYKAKSRLGRLRNGLRLTKTLPARYVVGAYGLAHLLNRALDDYRARQDELG